jgi:hypothetical protein
MTSTHEATTPHLLFNRSSSSFSFKRTNVITSCMQMGKSGVMDQDKNNSKKKERKLCGYLCSSTRRGQSEERKRSSIGNRGRQKKKESHTTIITSHSLAFGIGNQGGFWSSRKQKANYVDVSNLFSFSYLLSYRIGLYSHTTACLLDVKSCMDLTESTEKEGGGVYDAMPCECYAMLCCVQ